MDKAALVTQKNLVIACIGLSLFTIIYTLYQHQTYPTLSYPPLQTTYLNSSDGAALLPLVTAATTTISSRPKVIFGATRIWQGIQWSDIFHFTDCEYNNCICVSSQHFKGIEDADVVTFAKARWTNHFPDMSWQVRQHQYWFMMTTESGAISAHVFPQRFNGKFNGTMMYRRDALIYYPFGKTEPTGMYNKTQKIGFVPGKSKGAFAYVSNCNDGNYKRLDLMEELAKYIPVDIFSKTCSKKRWPHIKSPPCPRIHRGSNPMCETKKHQPYRFFLSFENSLCFDYITEKFWDRLKSTSNFIPVVMGGLSVEDYTRVAPPNSFIHVYNFSSVETLGHYLKYLSENDNAYNRYHEWRYNYRINTKRNISACEMCKLAHTKPVIPAINNIAQWRNNASLCRTYEIR